MQGKQIDQLRVECVPQGGLREIDQYIYNDEILYYCRYQLKATRPKFCHMLLFLYLIISGANYYNFRPTSPSTALYSRCDGYAGTYRRFDPLSPHISGQATAGHGPESQGYN